MPVGETVRDGELTAEALANAIGAEQAQGRRPHLLLVGSQGLREAALRIIDGPDAFSCLRVGLPRVDIDSALAPHEWELCDSDEAWRWDHRGGSVQLVVDPGPPAPL